MRLLSSLPLLRELPDPGVVPGGPGDGLTPPGLLRWLARRQWRSLLGGICAGVVWMVSLALVPAVLGKAVDEGLVGGDTGALVRWSFVLAGLGLLSAVMGAVRHSFAVTNWLQASYRSARIAEASVRDAGPALTRVVPAGEVLAVLADDAFRLGGVFDVAARFSGAVVSFVVVAVILLAASPELGLLVLVGAPVLVSSLALVVRPLQRRQAEQREQAGRLLALGADTVAGLRVLKGIGGEQVFLGRYRDQSQQVRAAGVRVAGVQATLDSAQVLLPGVFVVLVTWLGARAAVAGEITAGQLVAFYGYTAFLTMPLRTATEFLDGYVRARVGAGRLLRLRAVPPDQSDHLPTDGSDRVGPVRPAALADLTDDISGVRLPGGRFTALVSARPEESAGVADRLGRLGPAADGVRWGGTPLDTIPREQVRARVLVSEPDPRLFTGPVREALAAGLAPDADPVTDETLLAALTTAAAHDVLESLPEGLESELEERGRSLSGGQRQRLALARSLVADRDVLVLVEPTSAVDTHTEATIAGRLVDHRLGRTTLVATASPLLLDRADHVLFLRDGVVTAAGTHRELMATDPAYRSVVQRGEDDDLAGPGPGVS